MSAPVASLGMYDHPGQRHANDALWTGVSRHLADRGIAAPRALDRTRTVEAIWRDRALLLGQACGYPLVSQPDLTLQVVAIPHYAVPDGPAGTHVSYLVVRQRDAARTLDDLRGRIAAVNARHSNTGHNLFRAKIAPLADGARFFRHVVETGSHRASIAAVAQGAADIAAIDAVSFAGIARHEPGVAAAVRVLDTTGPSPTTPFVTAAATDPDTLAALRDALAAAIRDPTLAEACDALFLTGIAPVDRTAFAGLRRIEADAIAAGYPTLA